MKWLVSAALLLLGLPAQAVELGGNYNQALANVYPGLVARADARWVRAFVNVPRNFLTFDRSTAPAAVTGVLEGNIAQPADAVSGEDEILAASALAALPQLKTVRVGGEPVKVILSLKLDFKYLGMGIPSAVRTPVAFQSVLSAVARILEQNDLGASLDILVLGNEPMFEVPVSSDPVQASRDADEYGAFLEALIDLVDGLRARHGWTLDIFTGALDEAYTLRHDPILKKILEVTKANPKLSGIDLHLHVGAVDEAEQEVAYVQQQLAGAAGGEPLVIVTEFSLVDLWDANASTLCPWLRDAIAAAASGKPIRKDAFLAYFAAQPWYPHGWFADFVEMFRRRGVHAATYGLQGTPRYPTAYPDCAQVERGEDHLWLVDYLYNGTLLGLGADGFYETNPLAYPDYRRAVGGGRTDVVPIRPGGCPDR